MKKGFTLIELLAVIVILAIVAVISTPLIINVINNVKKSALEDSAYGIVEAANLYYAKQMENGLSADLLFTPDTTKKGMYNENNKLSYKGSLPDTGSSVLIKTDGTVGVKIISGDLCAVKPTTDTKVTILKSDCATNIDGSINEELSSGELTLLKNQLAALQTQVELNNQTITSLQTQLDASNQTNTTSIASLTTALNIKGEATKIGTSTLTSGVYKNITVSNLSDYDVIYFVSRRTLAGYEASYQQLSVPYTVFKSSIAYNVNFGFYSRGEYGNLEAIYVNDTTVKVRYSDTFSDTVDIYGIK